MFAWFIRQEDGYASLTTAGTVTVIVLALLCVLLIGALGKKKTYSTRQLCFAGIAVALAFLLSYVKLFRLPWGGSVTLLSMLFITMIGYWYGPRVGFTAAFAYSMLQFVQGGGSYMLSLWQICFDYFFAFTALGVSGFFRKQKNGLVTGYLAGVLLRGAFHSVGGYLYWMEYMPENFPKSLEAIYPICYNYAYLLAEAAITVIIISVPAVKKALNRIRNMAEA